MALRIDIDADDFAVMRKETGKRFTRKTAMIAGAVAAHLFFSGFAGFGAWRAFEAVSNARLAGAPLAGPAVGLGASIFMLALLSVIAVFAFRARKQQRNERRNAGLKNGVNCGRLEFMFSGDALVIKGALATRRAVWASLDRVSETKSNIVFWRRGAVFAFIPKNSLRDPAFFEKLMRIHGPAIKNKLSKDGAVADPHRVSFECDDGDFAEFRMDALRRTDRAAAMLQQTARWPAWPSILFVFSLAGAGLAAYAFVTTLSIAAGGVAIGAGALTGALVFFNPSVFRNARHHSGGSRKHPFARNELIAISLFKGGVRIERAGLEETYPWSAFERFAVYPHTAYLVTGPTMATPIPKRAFLDNVHFKTFAAFARALIADAKKSAKAASKARFARQLSPGAKAKKLPPAARAPKALPRPAAPKALPPASAPKASPGKKSQKSALDAVRSSAKAQVAALT